MPRAARKKSENGYYHLTMRGVGRQIIFEERSDYIYFLHLLKRFSAETNVSICAFCLMENHVHLLVYDKADTLSLFMKKLGGVYSWHFNNKYDRPGHLFQNRFGSVPIESEEQMLKAVHYILNNPREAGICPASAYEWSSYSRYGHPNSFVDTVVLQELLGSFEEYAEFIDTKSEDPERETEPRRLSDESAKDIVREVMNGDSGTLLRTYDSPKRDEILRILKEKGLSVRQIERLTGTSKSVVQRA